MISDSVALPEILDPPPVLGRILVVEDDRDVSAVVAEALRREGYDVAEAATAVEALALVERRGLPSLAIVDIHLPGPSGLEFCRRVQRTCDLPVILLTGESDAAIKAEAIRSCAEDYIVKPFHLDELLARVQRVLRRTGSVVEGPEVHLGGGVSVDFYARTLTSRGRAVELTPIESRLLHILLAHEGTVLPARYLGHRVWPEMAMPEETLRVHMSRLRRKLGMLDPDVLQVRTERGEGYRLERRAG